VPVEKQVAIIYLGTQGLLQNIPVDRVKEFEEDYITMLESTQRKTLDNLRAGIISDADTQVLRNVAKDVEIKFLKK
jgi:F-type H+-transporting ATPase subunit alpha